MHPSTRRNIGLLIEGHVQYQFMTIREIEKFYSAFYPLTFNQLWSISIRLFSSSSR